jgi:two-component system chemotaxis response regulator CheY
MDDRRTSPRRDIILRVDYDDAAEFWSDYTENLSVGGTFILTNQQFERGDEVSFGISFPGLLEPIKLRGEVVWRRPPGRSDRDAPPGIGVRFLFRDDTERRVVEAAIQRILYGDDGEESDRLAAFTILLAEDNHLVCELFSYGVQKLARETFKTPTRIDVVEAADGASAWDKLQAGRFDLVVLDMYLPVLGGAEIIERMRSSERYKRTPVLAISAGGRSARKSALVAGADMFLDKPVTLIEVLATIKRLLSGPPESEE